MTNLVSLSFLSLGLVCGQPEGWMLSSAVRTLAPDVEEVTVSLAAPTARKPPVFRVLWSLPQRDIPHLWCPSSEANGIPPDWGGAEGSSIVRGAPVYAFHSGADENRLTVAAGEVVRPVSFKAGLHEEDCTVRCQWEFFADGGAPSTQEVVRLRFDRRRIFWSETVRDGAAWVDVSAKREPANISAAAFAPLYSSWYAFHQDVSAAALEAECARAAALGMKTLIVDDGWQTDDTGRGYDFCGDWEVSARRFPDMAAHVAKVRALGLRYVMWYAVPYVGVNAKACGRFRGKFLREPRKGAAGILDPRFPEVRSHLAGLYERALREWDLDGFKLDFIDAFGSAPDVPEAVDALMDEISRRLRAVKPDVLVEFRQGYVGPAMRAYGNMLRVSDCPGDAACNRRGIARLRLTSGATAVHSDMIEWHPSDTAEGAARAVLNALFGTVQYSMRLGDLPEDHLAMMRNWIGFSRRHEAALLHGAFRPCGPQQGCPVLVGEDATERIVGVYEPNLVVDVGAADRPVVVLNATPRDRLVLRLAAPAHAVRFDTFGRETGSLRLAAGLVEADCPVSGRLELAF